MGLRAKAVIAGAVAVFAATGGHAALSSARTVAAGAKDCAQLEALWMAAGGAPRTAHTAAEIAMAESGGNQYAVSSTDDIGYFQINKPVWGPAMATFDPYGNARAAVIISRDGTDWYPWTTYTSGAYQGRC
jgi:hypothetical protein